MYKLLIEDINGIWIQADLGDDKPAMNYQANNLAELKDRQAGYSQALKLPITKTNCLIFGMSEQMDIVTDFPYQRHDCRLFSNDFVLAGTGSFLVLDKVTTDFEVQILCGNADLFSLLGNSPMANLDLGYYILGSKHLIDDYSDDTFCIPRATFLKGGVDSFSDDPDHLYPFIYLKKIIEQICTQNGYSLETNLTNWGALALPTCTLIPSSNSLTPFICNFYGTGVQNPLAKSNLNIGILSNEAVNCSVTNDKKLLYTVQSDCKITFNYYAIANSNAGGVTIPFTTIVKQVRDGEETTIYSNINVPAQIVTGYQFPEVEFNLLKGDLIYVYTELGAMPVIPDCGISFTYHLTPSIVDTSTLPAKSRLYFSNNLGFDNQLDLFKAFVQLFGLTVNIDSSNKVVHAYTLQKVYDNKPNAFDWSAKLHEFDDKQMTYALAGYGQKNNIKFSDNSDDNVIDSGYFSIDNQGLDATKDLFSIAFEAGMNKILNDGVNTGNFPLEEKDKDGNVTFKGGKPHIVQIERGVIDGGGYVNRNVAINCKVQSFIDTYYPRLVEVLTSTKIIEQYFFLTDQDIESFDPFTPVYISKYGAYFYVNKIINYVSGELTKCQLIKL